MSDNTGCVVPLLVVVGCTWFAVRDADWVVKAYAANHYDVPSSKVSISGKPPHDCDFMTAPLGSKHCSYKREYGVDWFTLSGDKPPRPMTYGTLQEGPPGDCSLDPNDFAHRCYYTELKPDEHATFKWMALSVTISWKKIEE